MDDQVWAGGQVLLWSRPRSHSQATPQVTCKAPRPSYPQSLANSMHQVCEHHSKQTCQQARGQTRTLSWNGTPPFF